MTEQEGASSFNILSSIHGRDRRKLRQIEKCDLQMVRLYGDKEKQVRMINSQKVIRWKFTYMDTVLITNEAQDTEITSYVKPIDIVPVPLTSLDKGQHIKLRESLRKNPTMYTSHTVLIVDKSSSMKTCDVDNFKERIHAVYGTIALDFIGNTLDNHQCCESDVVSLIEFANQGTVIWDREPATNVLFNEAINRMHHERPSQHGYFLDPIHIAIRLLERDKACPHSAISVVFLSDGKPSDVSGEPGRRLHPDDFESRLSQAIATLVTPFKERLSFTAIGFAGIGTDFQCLERMASYAKLFGANGRYVYASGKGAELSTVMSSVVSQTQDSRLSLSRYGSAMPRVMRQVEEEPFVVNYSLGDSIDPADWKIYPDAMRVVHEFDPRKKKWTWSDRHGMLYQGTPTEGAIGVAVRKKAFAKGAERVVYQLLEVKKVPAKTNRWVICSQSLCAKEPLFEEDEKKKYEFHGTFCKTSHRARKLVVKFMAEVNALFKRHKLNPFDFASMEFLPCSVYEVSGAIGDPPWHKRGFLAEPLLEHAKYEKWNGNNGYVQSNMTARQKERLRVGNLAAMLDAIVEEPDEEEDEWGDDDSDKEKDELPAPTTRLPHHNTVTKSVAVPLSEYPQAFSHWSYRYRDRQAVICDLQGVVQEIDGVMTFRMTDPVIHYRGKERHQHGRTDHGARGIADFFATHQCGELCRLLGLPKCIPAFKG